MRRLTVALRWPVGVLLTAWYYMWRTTPLWRMEVEGAWPDDAPRDVSPTVPRDGVQRAEDGVGPLFRRRYRARIHDASMDAAALMETLKADPNRVAPGTLAHFQKERGDDGVLRVGDEFLVRMPAPWDGPIRVAEVTPSSFRFLTLGGHLEAGQIEWRARDEDDALVFEIESWARAGDKLSYFLHNHVPMAKETQLHMWTRVCERVATRVNGRLTEGVDIVTRRVEFG